MHAHPSSCNLLSSETDSWSASADIVDSKDALKEDVTEDGESNTSVALNTTVALSPGVVDWCVVDQAAGNGESLAANCDVEVGESCAAGEDVTTLARRVGGAGDLSVVCGDYSRWEVEERSAGVSNGSADRARGRGAGANGVATCSELPESVGGVDVGVGDRAGVLAGVDVAEVVGTCGVVFEVYSKELLGKRSLDGVEKGSSLVWRDGVDAAESKAEQTVVVNVLCERRAD